MRWVMVAAVAAVLAGCQTTEYAKGPVSLSPRAAAAYQNYKRLMAPLYFAVSTDGNSVGYTFCPDGGSCSGESTYPALENCRAYSKGVPCVIYAYRGEPMFKGDPLALARPPAIKPEQPTASAPPPPATTTQVMPEPRRPATPMPAIDQRLATLKDLHDRKLITPAEYEAKRKEILGAL